MSAMNVNKILAVVTMISLSCAGCLAPTEGETPNSETTAETAEASIPVGLSYGSRDFPFVESLRDDGKEKSGGWQTADTTFTFKECHNGIVAYAWECPIQIGMPLRCEAEGRITRNRAAYYSAEVANEVVAPLVASRPSWQDQGAAFCVQLRDKLEAKFKEKYPGVGAHAKRPY